VTPGTLIRIKIAAASNRDENVAATTVIAAQNVAATTVIAALIYTNGHSPPWFRPERSAPANAVSPVELNLAFTRWVPGRAASGFPN